MDLSLQHRLAQVLNDGASLLLENRQTIQENWQVLLYRLSESSSPPWNDHQLIHKTSWIAHLVMKYIPLLPGAYTEQIWKNFREEWQSHFPEPIVSNELILILSLLENTVHQAVRKMPGVDEHHHQAIHYLFSTLGQLMLRPGSFPIDTQDFLRNLFGIHHIPLHWIARVHYQAGNYSVKEILFPKEHEVPLPLLELVKMLHAETLECLTEAIVKLIGQPAEQSRTEILSFSLNQEKLLFATDKETIPYMKPFLSLALQLLTQHQKLAMQEGYWKDALILFAESIIQAKNLQETLENISAGFVKYLPFERAALFSYSQTDHSGIGIFGYQVNDHAIRKIREQISNIPLIDHGLQKIQPIYVPNAAQGFPYHYVEQFQLESVVVTPLFSPSKNKMIGAAVLDQGEGKPFDLPGDTLTALMKFSKHAAETLVKYWNGEQWYVHSLHNVRLSPREYDVLKLMAEGASISEAAQALYLSEYTVRDYVTAAMKKLNAKNRTHAVAIALKLGLIS